MSDTQDRPPRYWVKERDDMTLVVVRNGKALPEIHVTWEEALDAARQACEADSHEDASYDSYSAQSWESPCPKCHHRNGKVTIYRSKGFIWHQCDRCRPGLCTYHVQYCRDPLEEKSRAS